MLFPGDSPRLPLNQTAQLSSTLWTQKHAICGKRKQMSQPSGLRTKRMAQHRWSGVQGNGPMCRDKLGKHLCITISAKNKGPHFFPTYLPTLSCIKYLMSTYHVQNPLQHAVNLVPPEDYSRDFPSGDGGLSSLVPHPPLKSTK